MRLPKINIVKLPEGQKGRFARILRLVMVANVGLCGYYFNKNKHEKASSEDIEKKKFEDESKVLQE